LQRGKLFTFYILKGIFRRLLPVELM